MRKKYPIVRQEDYKDCGAACLSMIIAYYGGHVPYEQLKEKLEVSKNGVVASTLIAVAKKSGFASKGIEGDWNQFQEEVIIFPCIAHLLLEKSYYHYVVIYEMNIKKKYFIIADPAKGIYKMSFTEFEQVWNHIILTFYPRVPIIYVETNNLLKKTFLAMLKKENKPFLMMILLSMIVTIVSIFCSMMLEHFISMLDHHDENAYLYGSILLYASFIFLKNMSSFFRNKLFFHVYQRIDFQFMNFIFNQILKLPYRYYKNRTTGEMIARIEDIGIIRSFLSTIILSSLMDLPLFIVSGMVLYVINNKLFTIALITSLLYFFLFWIYQKRICEKVEQLEEESAKVTSYMVEVLGGYESVFGSHLKNYVQDHFDKQYFNLTHHTKKLEQIQNESHILNQSVYDIALLSLLGVGILLVAKNELSIASLLLFHSLFLYFIDPVRSLLRLGEEWKKVKVSWKRLSNLFLDTKELGIYEKTLSGDIVFQNVSFAYVSTQTVLKNVSFHIKKGDKVLLVGESGNGKSTILKLLMKYYEVTRGSIYFDQIDINDYKEETISQNIVYVSMKEQLFTGPLYQNVLLSQNPNEQYENVLHMTEVNDIIRKSPLGHHLVLEENGANLSGGEKQRVILARTLLLPFEILLLDEATSQLDSDMERRILKRLFQNYPDKTVIMIAHRLDNCDLFDQMIEISDGIIQKDVRKHG